MWLTGADFSAVWQLVTLHPPLFLFSTTHAHGPWTTKLRPQSLLSCCSSSPTIFVPLGRFVNRPQLLHPHQWLAPSTAYPLRPSVTMIGLYLSYSALSNSWRGEDGQSEALVITTSVLSDVTDCREATGVTRFRCYWGHIISQSSFPTSAVFRLDHYISFLAYNSICFPSQSVSHSFMSSSAGRTDGMSLFL